MKSRIAEGAYRISHDRRSFVLLLAGGVGIGAEGEACVIMAQHGGNGFHVYAV